MIKKIVNILLKINLIIILICTVLSTLQLQIKINYLNKRYNEITKNELELSRRIQDGFREKSTEDRLIYYEIDGIKLELDKLIQKIIEPDLKKLLNSNVFVSTPFGKGSGTVIKKTDKEMYILTCYHVIAENIIMNQSKIEISVGYSKTGKLNQINELIAYEAEVVKFDEENDLALLKTSTIDDNLKVALIAEKEPEKGDIVYSIGNPLITLRTISKGILANKEDGFYFSDNTITFGNSGGGLYNSRGELIGVPSQVMGYKVGEDFVPESGLGMSIDLLRIKTFLKDVI